MAEQSQYDPAVLLRIYQLLTRIHAQPELGGKLQAVVDAVVEAVGFELAALNVLRPSGDFEVVAVAGDERAREELLGVTVPLSTFEAEFAVSEQWGQLRFIPHERAAAPYPGSWVPDRAPAPGARAWHPEDALLAPLHSPRGDLIGVLSVDLPRDGRRPSPAQRGLLEVLATEVAVALHNGMLSQQLRVSEEILRQAFDGSGGGVALSNWIAGRPGPFIRVNPALCVLLGRTQQQLLTLTEAIVTSADHRSQDEAGLADLASGLIKAFRRDKQLIRADGTSVWVTVTTTLSRGQDGTPHTMISQIEDISTRRSEWEDLQYRATHDPLTALPHRPAVLARLSASVEQAGRTGRTGMVMFLDLDDFKQINDTHGHLVGDEVLRVLAGRIRATVREQDMASRLGGDEFVVVADDLAPDRARALAQRLRVALAAPVPIRAVEPAMLVSVSVSVGLCVVDGGTEPLELLRSADLAMYRHKQSRRGLSSDGVDRK